MESDAPIFQVTVSGGDDRPPAQPETDATLLRFRRNEPVDSEIQYKGQRRRLRIWMSRVVGSGAFGVVFSADMFPVGSSGDDSESQLVAVKTFKSLVTDEEFTSLVREVSRWKVLDHPRILPFYGMCEFGVRQVGLVSPLITKGNMKEYIAKFPDKNRLRLLQHVAEGLHYLHVKAGIVHGDLKCANVVISDDECALVADFGLSTFIERTGNPTATSIRMRNTAAFAAPELFTDQAFNDPVRTTDMKPRSKTPFTDSFAFASLVYEACAGQAPWSGSHEIAVINNVQEGKTPARVVANPLYLPFSEQLWNLCLACWVLNPFARPNSTTILEVMTELALPEV